MEDIVASGEAFSVVRNSTAVYAARQHESGRLLVPQQRTRSMNVGPVALLQTMAVRML